MWLWQIWLWRCTLATQSNAPFRPCVVVVSSSSDVDRTFSGTAFSLVLEKPILLCLLFCDSHVGIRVGRASLIFSRRVALLNAGFRGVRWGVGGVAFGDRVVWLTA